MMRLSNDNHRADWMMLLARVLMMVLFVPSGWQKLLHFTDTVTFMGQINLPLPAVAASIAVMMELLVGAALVVGLYARPLAAALAVFTLATAFIGHHYWTETGADRYADYINFYKNIAIMGGLLLLSATGPGRYSLDRR